MSTTIHYNIGDTAALQYQIVVWDGIEEKEFVNVDLTNKSVQFYMVHDEYPTIGVFGATCEIVDADQGWIMYSFATGETDIAGMYNVYFKVTDSTTGEIITYPDQFEYQALRVVDTGLVSL